ncbi:MAG TPA: hypothetical protein VGF75_06645, partial [Candidatus Saccharimonadales bacterium]
RGEEDASPGISLPGELAICGMASDTPAPGAGFKRTSTRQKIYSAYRKCVGQHRYITITTQLTYTIFILLQLYV